ncbi:MAG: hypothetical protein ACC650_08060, partial [Gammaproteobacteria bacterium]
DRVRLKGKKEPVSLYELKTLTGALNDQQSMCNQSYQKGIAQYESAKWDEAIVCFNAGLFYVEDDGPCLSMVERCKEFIENPPTVDWEGVYDMTSK